MTCIYTGDDCLWCTCSACKGRRVRKVPIERTLDRRIPVELAKTRRRRPCPTAIPGSLDGIVPTQPSRCWPKCTCCAVCRGVEFPFDVQWWHYCTCPEPTHPESSCVRGHSALVECRGGCKPRPLAMAIVASKPSWLERALQWIARRLAL